MNAPISSKNLGHAERSIGAILIDAGRLKAEDAEKILRLQRDGGLRFGDAACKLGLVTEEDIQFALSRQFDYPYLQRGESGVADEVVAAYNPFHPQVEALRAVRSQLMLRWFDPAAGRRCLAIASPGREEGRSWLVANLAVVFSQLGERTLIIDADMRNPRQHLLFGVDNRMGLSAALSGRGSAEIVRRVPALVDLSVLPAGATPPNPQELISRPAFAALLKQYAEEYDVILVDTPAAGSTADTFTLAARVGGTLLVARPHSTRTAALRNLAGELHQAGITVVGSVLNDAG
ncbi:Putative non-specific protein-tyrosine kinase EpsG-like protein [Azoarcus sp. CIB]|uniref:chain length determinant protein tyrosine kinase EpsG n=1 Tax=Aromatoleum sp. (strain CIB) TaxID=198107 RepID=UPI00067BC404|nr:chain length determinant protein tyrosine kinase EpsG [Azoarcus sp. CIB]AKU11740.1 Putative non-specific protein-tyrosine kinase EpsG-like protein [Azoarcus sp. CIB]